MSSTQPNSSKSAPIPIDWVVPTSGCRLAIRGTGKKLGYWDIQSARDLTKKPSDEHPVEVDKDDCDNEKNRYRIDLFVESNKGGELEEVRNVMPPTNSKVFWDSSGPFGKFDGLHEMSAWQFTSNTECKYYFVGIMAYIWDVPEDLDPERTYRLKFTINSHADEEHISGPFRIRAAGNEILQNLSLGMEKHLPRRWTGYAFALLVVGIMVVLTWAHRAGVIELE